MSVALELLPILVGLGILVALDERGLCAGVVRTPVLVGAVSGVIGGAPGLGLTVGILFALLWPAPFRSGGHRALSPGIAALVGGGAVALAAGSGGGEGALGSAGVAELLRERGNAAVALAALLGGLGAVGHQAAELALRRRLSAATGSGLRARSLREVLLLGAAVGGATWGLGWVVVRLHATEWITAWGWDGGAWAWVLLAALLGGAAQLGRSRGQRHGLAEWAIGVGAGIGAALLLGGVF